MGEYRDFNDLNALEKEINTTGHVEKMEKFERLLKLAPKDFCEKEMHISETPLRMKLPHKVWNAMLITIGVLTSVGFIVLGIELIISDTGLSVIGMLMVFGSWLPILALWQYVAQIGEPLPISVLEHQYRYPLSIVPINETATCPNCNGKGTITVHHHKEGYWDNSENPSTGQAYGWVPDSSWFEERTCSNCNGVGTFRHLRAWIEELNRRITNFNSKIDEINNRVNQVNEIMENKNSKIQNWNNS